MALAARNLGLTLGPFDALTDRATVARFAAATRSAEAGVPATFPIVWLAHPDIRAAIEGFARPGEVAFHEEQTFDYRAPLAADVAYRLLVNIERQEGPARLVLTSCVEREGKTTLTMRTVLRLVATAASASAEMATTR